MEITAAMLRAARQAEFEFYRRTDRRGEWFRPMPDAQLKAVIEAVIGAIGVEDEPAPEPPPQPEEEFEAPPPRAIKTVIVRARKPKPRR
jgi:hypothetical protein